MILRSTYTPLTTHCLLLRFRVVAATTQVHLLVLSISCPAKSFKRSHVRCASQQPRDVCSLLSASHYYLWGWGDRLSTPPSPAASSAIVAYFGGKGLHADPLPHTLNDYISVVSVFFAGRGNALHSSSSHCRWVLRRRDRSSSSQHRYVLLSSRLSTVS